MAENLFLFPVKYEEVKSNIDIATNLVKESKLKEETKQKIYECLEFDITNPKNEFSWDWNTILNNVENIAPSNASVAEVDSFKKAIENIIKGKL